MNKVMLILTMLFLLAGSVGDAFAQDPEEEHQGGGAGDCIATWDPFCPTSPGSGGGGGGGESSDCSTCEYVPEGPDGQPEHYVCARDTSGCCGSSLSGCEEFVNGCDHDGYCVWA